ncbi:hypothetical protein F4821DRAFT_240218 [Hypoxylon rubiginosum]|uniref:Uncharacterized protein n=1 Tax=Hypoxylon rubiginosum TaxID=110542 RepID=A0ACC0CYU8_9PEZI|nr:hypothetical protein F4821DRAFT_240218 [Hypoxylon rubiginosum]
MPLFDEAGHPIHTQNYMRHNSVTPITDWSPFAALNNPLLMLFYIVVVVYVILCSVAAYFVTRKQVERRRNKPLFCLAYVGFTVFLIIFGVPLVVFGIIYSVIKTAVDKRRELLREKIAHEERKIRHVSIKIVVSTSLISHSLKSSSIPQKVNTFLKSLDVSSIPHRSPRRP